MNENEITMSQELSPGAIWKDQDGEEWKILIHHPGDIPTLLISNHPNARKVNKFDLAKDYTYDRFIEPKPLNYKEYVKKVINGGVRDALHCHGEEALKKIFTSVIKRVVGQFSQFNIQEDLLILLNEQFESKTEPDLLNL
jgi:hypothetical protein